MENEMLEFDTFEMEMGGEVKEFAIVDEFQVESKHYVAAALVVDDTVSNDGCYLFKSVKEDNEICIEKIADKDEYEKVSAVYLEL